MKSIIDQILQWPIIVQGALGSALFWLILTIGDPVVRKFGSIMRGFSKKRQLDILMTDSLRYRALIESDAKHLIVLLYAAVHFVVKALLSLCLALMFESVFPAFGFVGYAMAIYYLFMAGIAVRDTKPNIDAKAELKRVDDEIKRLKAEA